MLKKISIVFLCIFLLAVFLILKFYSKPSVLGVSTHLSSLQPIQTIGSARFTKDYLSNFSNLVIISETPVPSNTPTPTPTPKPTPYPPINLDDVFSRVSGTQSISKDTLIKIARCESGLNPRAVNGDYVGLYQFSTSTWIVTRIRMNHDPNPILRFSPLDAIETAAFKIATEGDRAWPFCRR